LNRAQFRLQIFGGDIFSLFAKFLAQRFADLTGVELKIGALAARPVGLDQLAYRAGVRNALKTNIANVSTD